MANLETCQIASGNLGHTNKDWTWLSRCQSSRIKFPPNLAKSTQRSKVTQFIANKKSRQEFEPPISTLYDKEVVEPLHLKNNGVQHLQSMLLDLAISSSNIPDKISSLSDLPPSSALFRYLKALESDVKAGQLEKQIGKCILEDRPKDKDFSYRLTGKDSKLVLHGFMFLVDAIKGIQITPN